MEPAAAEILSLKMEKGARAGLNNPSSILLSASAAKALFGDADPVDRTMTIDNKMTVKVAGVYEDIPHNSKFNNVQFIAPWELYWPPTTGLKDYRTDWSQDAVEIFVQLADNMEAGKVSAMIKIARWIN